MQRIVRSSQALTAALVAGATVAAAAQFGGGGPVKTPSALRAVPAETTAAKAKDHHGKAPRTPWGQADLAGIWTS